MMQVMLPLWLTYVVLCLVAITQGLALLMLSRYFRRYASEAKATAASFTAHLTEIEKHERLNSERFRTIMRSLDELQSISKVRSSQYYPPLPLSAPEAKPERAEEVRVSSNPQVSSYAEIRTLLEESEE